MPATYEPIASTTASTSISTVTFSSIPSTYTDLVLVMNVVSLTSGPGTYLRVTCNNDTATNYSFTFVAGDGSTAFSGRTSNSDGVIGSYTINAASSPSGTTFVKMNFQNYSNTTTNKTMITRAAGQNASFDVSYASLWRNTSAINRIDINAITGGTYNVGSMFTLYGIKAA